MTSHENHQQGELHKSCKVCSSKYSHEKNPSHLGICEKCAYKILIVLVVIMISVSYIAWFGVI